MYLAISLRNVGTGIAVCQGWTVRAGLGTSRDVPTHAPLDEYRLQIRDLYIPAGDIGMWQGALRNPDDPMSAAAAAAIDARQPLTVELLYTDQIGGQRTISRFGLIPTNDMWLASLTRHWYLDWEGPRPEGPSMAAAEALMRVHDAAQHRRALRDPEDPLHDDHDGTAGPPAGSSGHGLTPTRLRDQPPKKGE